MSRVCSSLINLMASCAALFLIMIGMCAELHWTMLLSVVPLFLLVVLALGIGLILATIAVKYRDVLHLYSVLMAVLMYLTPVIYPMSILPEWLYHLVIAAEAVLCLGVGCWVFYKHQDGFIFDL